MFERFTDTARRTVVLAQEEARMLNHNYVGTEHLLLALTGDKGPAGQALTGHGVTRDKARNRLIRLIGEGVTPSHGHIPFTPAAKDVLQAALRLALQIDHNYIGSEHLLLALLTDSASVASQVVKRCGAQRRATAWRLAELIATSPAHAEMPKHGFVLSA